MSILLLGPLIKQKREELGLTQEDLADGICSVPTLSRIENGERIPNQNHSEMLLQRLGYSDSLQINYVPEKTLELHELKFNIRQAIIHNKREEALALLDAFEANADSADCLNAQFLLIYRTILSDAPDDVRLERFLEAVHMTNPRFDAEHLPAHLSYEEIIAINNIASCTFALGRMEEAIDLQYALLRHYDCQMVNREEILRTQLMVYYNLSKYLVNAERYDESVRLCDEGIRIAQETGRCSYLDRLLFYKSRALLGRNQPGDYQAAEEAARTALSVASGLGNEVFRDHYVRFIQAFFEQDPSSEAAPGSDREEAKIS